MIPRLPDDVLYLVIDQLAQTNDFYTLNSCARAAKSLAAPAIPALYRMYQIAPITNRGRDENMQLTPYQLTSRWCSLWKSITLSCVGTTAYPYCDYIRVLDLGDLLYLFDDVQFNGRLLKSFFADLGPAVGADGAEEKTTSLPNTAPATRSVTNAAAAAVYQFGPKNGVKRGWDMDGDVERMGELITQKSSLVEELDGNLSATVLLNWIPRLKKLTRIRVWNGTVLANYGPLLATNCPFFKTAEFYHWAPTAPGTSADEECALLLRDVREQSLDSIQVIGRAAFGPLTFTALSERQGTSLTELILNDLPAESLSELNLLKSCTNLVTLRLSLERCNADLAHSHPGVYDEVIAWLRECRRLTSIKFKFGASASVVTPLLHGSLKLQELELREYAQADALAFYKALPLQSESLKELVLQSETEEDPERIMQLVETICKLRRLTNLDLKSISDYFQNDHFILISSSLRQLKELWLSGWAIGDKILDALAGLHSLERMELYGYSEFTRDGLLDYISQLRPGNKGLFLGVSMAAPYSALSELDQETVRQAIRDRVDGRFEYTLARDPDADDDGSESDSD